MLLHRAHASASGSDEGFTFVELLVALSLLLITLIAVMGLSMTSNFMAVAARQRAAMVNAAAGYLERARQEPYAHVGTPGGDPAGDLVTIATTSSPYTVRVTPTVIWGRPEDPANRDYKTVMLSVSSSKIGGGSEMTYGTSAVIADVATVGGSTSVATTPSVTVASPVDGSVVWGTDVSVTASATAGASGMSLIWIDILDGVQSWGSVAVNGSSAQNVWHWNTTLAREGAHRLTPRVTDSGRNTADGIPVTLTVDNVAPTAPTAPGSAYPSGTDGRVWWTAATDGTGVDGITPLTASHYVVSVLQQPLSATLAADPTKWTPVAGLTLLSVVTPPTSASPLSLAPLAGFSRYAVTVNASSPDRGTISGLLSAPVTTVGVTKATASGTWRVALAGGKYTVNVSVNIPSGPTFPWTGTASTKFYRLTSPTQAITSGTLLATVSSGSPTWITTAAADTQTTTSGGTPVRYYYAAVTTLTPTGYGSASTAVSTCVLAPPADITTSGTRALVISQW